MMEFPYKSNHKSKLKFTWEINLEEDVLVDDEKSTYEFFDIVENYDLYSLFGVFDEEKIVSKCINLIVDENEKKIC